MTEIQIGGRRFRARFEDGTELQATEAPLEFRLGIGADIRLSKAFSLTPLVTLGAGSFGEVEWVSPSGKRTSAIGKGDDIAGHGWVYFPVRSKFRPFRRRLRAQDAGRSPTLNTSAKRFALQRRTVR